MASLRTPRGQATLDRIFVARISAIVTLSMLVAFFSARPASAQALTSFPIVAANFSGITEIGSGIGQISQMTFGPDGKLYIATFNSGIRRYDYSPSGNLSNGITVWSRTDTTAQKNGSLGIAFHQDATLGTVMYIAPAISSAFSRPPIPITQSIMRLTDNDGDGNWGETGEVRQEIVNNLALDDLHQVNQMLVRGNSLYVPIGSRLRSGGEDSEYTGAARTDDGEYAYTGNINWISDLTALDSDTTTPNVAGFTIAAHHTDTQTFTSTNPGKLRAYSTGFRNPYGIAFDRGGTLWATMNQNESPHQKPDELHKIAYKEDHGFAKRNEVSGDWKTNPDALAAGFFQTTKAPVTTFGNNVSADGLEFTYRNHAFAGHPIVARWAVGDLLAVDPTTGATTQIATNFPNPLDVFADPFGNLLIGAYGNTGRVYRITLLNDAGDYNENGVVDSADYVLWRKTLGQTGSNLPADGDGNGTVDQADFDIWRGRFGASISFAAAGSGAAVVPEPATIALLFSSLGIGLTLCSRSRR